MVGDGYAWGDKFGVDISRHNIICESMVSGRKNAIKIQTAP
jgi:hypothetical protein